MRLWKLCGAGEKGADSMKQKKTAGKIRREK